MSRFSPHNIYYPFSRGSAEQLATTLEAAVRSRLVESVDGPTEVYLSVTSPRAVMPFIIVSPLRFSMPTITNKSSYWELSPLQITVFSADDLESERIGRLCMKAIRAGPLLRFDDGVHMTGWPGGTRKWPQAEIGPGGKLAFRFEFDWVFMVGRDSA